MSIDHSLLTGTSLHNSRVLTFTGNPDAYVPTEVGILVECVTSPNVGKIYRTTGLSAGALDLLAPSEQLPPLAVTFTGSESSYIPSETGILVLKTDVTPNQLYRTTGTTAGSIEPVGSVSNAGSSTVPITILTSESPPSSVFADLLPGQMKPYIFLETDSSTVWGRICIVGKRSNGASFYMSTELFDGDTSLSPEEFTE